MRRYVSTYMTHIYMSIYACTLRPEVKCIVLYIQLYALYTMAASKHLSAAVGYKDVVASTHVAGVTETRLKVLNDNHYFILCCHSEKYDAFIINGNTSGGCT